MGIKGWRKDEEDKCAKGNEEDVHHSGRGQSLTVVVGSG